LGTKAFVWLVHGQTLRAGGNDAKKLRLVKLGGISNVVLEESVSLVIGKYIASLGKMKF